MEQSSTPLAPAEPPANQQQSTEPAKTLTIVGFILAFVISVAGLIVSIVAFNKSKKAGHKNGLAVAGIIISSVVTLVWTVFISIAVVTAISIAGNVIEQCNANDSKRVYASGSHFDCPKINSSSIDDKSDKTSPAVNVVGTEVSLAGSLVEAKCFTFTLPEEYLLSPNAKNCQAELRADNGSETGIALTSMTVKYQTGSSTLDDFFAKYKAAAGDKASNEKRMTIDGRESGSIDIVNGMGIPQTVYFIPENSGAYEYNGIPVTSFHISGPANLSAPLETIVNSFSVK